MYVRQVNDISWDKSVHEICYITATWNTKDKFHWPCTGNLEVFFTGTSLKVIVASDCPNVFDLTVTSKTISGFIIAFRLLEVQCMYQFNDIITDFRPWVSNLYMAKCQPYPLLRPGLWATSGKNNSKWYIKLHTLFCNCYNICTVYKCGCGLWVGDPCCRLTVSSCSEQVAVVITLGSFILVCYRYLIWISVVLFAVVTRKFSWFSPVNAFSYTSSRSLNVPWSWSPSHHIPYCVTFVAATVNQFMSCSKGNAWLIKLWVYLGCSFNEWTDESYA